MRTVSLLFAFLFATASLSAAGPKPLFDGKTFDGWDGDGHLLFTAERGVRAEPERIDLATGKREPATRRAKFTPPGNAFLKDVALGAQKAVHWKSPDGLDVEGVLTTPPAEAGVKPPYKLRVHPHGGPHGRTALG